MHILTGNAYHDFLSGGITGKTFSRVSNGYDRSKNNSFNEHIMSVQYTRGYHEYSGGDIMSILGVFSTLGDIMSTPGDIMTNVGKGHCKNNGICMETPVGNSKFRSACLEYLHVMIITYLLVASLLCCLYRWTFGEIRCKHYPELDYVSQNR